MLSGGRVALSAAVVLVLAACGGDPGRSDVATPVASAPGTVADSGRWTPALAERAFELLEEAAERVNDGAPMTDALEYVRADPHVISAMASEDALVFRLQGSPATWLVRRDDAGAARADLHLAKPDPPSMQLASVVGEDTSGDGEIDNRDAKRALVLAPYYWDFAPNDESDQVAAALETAPGYAGNVRLVANRTRADQAITIDDWVSFTRYDAIFISTHGKRVCYEAAATCETMIHTGIRLDGPTLEEATRVSGSEYRGFGMVGTVTQEATPLEVGLSMDPHTFEARYPDGLDDSLLVLSACESGGIAGRAFAEAAAGDDFAMLGWTEVVGAADAFTASLALIERLALGMTSRQAYLAVADAGLARATSSAGITRLEHISPGGDELRIRELPTLLKDGEPVVDGTSLPAAIIGRPGDGAADRLRLELRVAGVHRLNAYVVRYEIDGRQLPGRYYLEAAQPADEELAYRVTHNVDAGGDLPTGLVRLTVIVHLPEGGESRYTAVVALGGCTFEVRIGSVAYTAQPGDVASYASSGVNTPDGIEWLSFVTADGDRNILLTPLDGPLPPVPGRYALHDIASGIGYDGLGAGYTNYPPEDIGTLDILEFEPHRLLVGEVTGIVRDSYEGSDGAPIPFSMSFSISPTDDQGGFFSYGCAIPEPPES